MYDRIILFRHKFPDKIISRTGLYRLYKKSGARKKQVRLEKQYSTKQKIDFPVNRQKVIDDLKHAYDNDLPIVYLDEIVFTKTSIGK